MTTPGFPMPYTTPRSADLTDTTGVGSLLIIPTPRCGDA